jgi:subfamily B ATP-binding cassette protein MsbA
MAPPTRLLPWLRPYRGRFVAALALGLVAALAEGFTYSLLIPFLRLLFGADAPFPPAATPVEAVLRAVVGGPLGAADGRAALVLVLGCIAVGLLVKNAALYGAAYVGLVVQEGVARDLRLALYARLQRLGLPFFTRTRTGELAARVLSDTDQTRGAVQDFGAVLRSAVTVTVYVTILAALAWRLAVAALVVALLVTAALRPLVRAVRSRWGAVLAHRGALAAITVETALAARAVKAAAAEPQEAARFAAAAESVRRGVLRAEGAAMLASPVTETVAGGAILLLAAASGGAGLRPEVFVTFVAVALRMLSPLKAVAQYPALLAETRAAADRLHTVLDRPPEEDDPPDSLPFPGLGSAIEYRNVWVAYEPGTWVLRDVSLRLGRGEVVAVVGPSGAGKSTLADLLPRFVEPARGGVFVDGVPLARIRRGAVRAALGIVSQDTVLLHETVRANIAYGDRADASRAEIEAAARAAHAAGFIARLPEGYDTVIGERGVRLSGGERQRLAIARALLRDPPLLILDEATAQLDAEAEREVQEAVARLMAGRTVLVIAHRLATVAHADRVIVLDGGRIVEEGPPAALLAAGGRYHRMVELQTLGDVPASPPVSGRRRVERGLEVEDGDR